MRGAVAVEMIAATGAPRTGLGGDFNTALEFVAARTGHRIDHATGGAAELDRVATGLDLELLKKANGAVLKPRRVYMSVTFRPLMKTAFSATDEPANDSAE